MRKGHKLKGKERTQQGCQHFKKFTGVGGFAHHPYNTRGGRPGAQEAALQGRHLALQHPARCRPSSAGGARACDQVRAADLLHRVRHPDQPAHPRADQPGRAGRVDQPDGLPRLAEPVDQERLPVRARGCRGGQPAGVQHRARVQNGTPKPSLDAYRLPIWVVKHGTSVTLWAWVRPANGTPQQRPDPAQHRGGLHHGRHEVHGRPRLHQREPGRQRRHLAHRLDRPDRPHGRTGHVANDVLQPVSGGGHSQVGRLLSVVWRR